LLDDSGDSVTKRWKSSWWHDKCNQQNMDRVGDDRIKATPQEFTATKETEKENDLHMRNEDCRLKCNARNEDYGSS
jgi:hypothetical protein